jgi:two-component system, NarL family, invasion response regulator UvrY
MKFLVVDDHPLMRRGVRQILDEAYVDAAVTEAESGERAVDCVRAEGFDLVLLDISMPGLSGLETMERIHRTRPGQRVLVLSMHAEEQFAVQALRAGASGYMTKDHASDLLLAAISRIMSGGRYLSPALAEILAGQVAGDLDGPPHGRLSAREFRVMCMLAEGHGLSHIANELALSVKTISTYRTRVLEKLGMGSNAEVARYCQRNGLVG